jgi:hypothetical protein
MCQAPDLEVLQVRLIGAERGRGIGGGLIGLGFGHRQRSTGPGRLLAYGQAGKLAGPGYMFAIVVHALSRFPRVGTHGSTHINTWEGPLSRLNDGLRSTVRPWANSVLTFIRHQRPGLAARTSGNDYRPPTEIDGSVWPTKEQRECPSRALSVPLDFA